MEDRIQMVYRIQPIHRLSSTMPFTQEGNRMNSKEEKENRSDTIPFSRMLLEEGSQYERKDDSQIITSSSYGRDAKEVAYYKSKFDIKQ